MHTPRDCIPGGMALDRGPGLIRMRRGWQAASPPFRFASVYERHFNQPSDRFGPRWLVFCVVPIGCTKDPVRTAIQCRAATSLRTQFLWRVARGHAAAGLSLMGLVNEGSSCGRPAHDHWMTSPSSGQHTRHYSPVIIAPFIESLHRDGVRKKFWLPRPGRSNCGKLAARSAPLAGSRINVSSHPRA
jgi:hypothetical protein